MKLRSDVATARRLIMPVIVTRKKEAEEAVKACKNPKVYTDAIAWIEESSEKRGEPYDPVFWSVASNNNSDRLGALSFDLLG